MAFLKFAGSVKVPKTVIIAAATINTANALGLTQDVLVTAGNNGVHARGSAHYTDEALDIRSHNFSTEDKHKFVETLRTRLGREYTVLLEDEGLPNEHIHCQVAIAFRAPHSDA